MKVKINYNSDDLWCLYDKEIIEIDEKYIEVVEDVLGEEVIKTYRYTYLHELISEFLDNDEEAIIEEEY
jgi:hypothetical protein